MDRRAITLGRRIVLSLFLGTLGLVLWGSTVWASTRLAPGIEIQAWYRMRHTFQTDSDHFEWVQWRNEGFIWLSYEKFYKTIKADEKVFFIKGKVAEVMEDGASKQVTVVAENALTGEKTRLSDQIQISSFFCLPA